MPQARRGDAPFQSENQTWIRTRRSGLTSAGGGQSSLAFAERRLSSKVSYGPLPRSKGDAGLGLGDRTARPSSIGTEVFAGLLTISAATTDRA